MGYFANGTEGEMYEERYCSKCVHGESLREDGINSCPVWAAHLMHNYAECNKPDSILHLLIPRKGVHNGECKMFLPVVTK